MYPYSTVLAAARRNIVLAPEFSCDFVTRKGHNILDQTLRKKFVMIERGVLTSIFRRPVTWNQTITIPKRAFGVPKHGLFRRVSSTSGYSPPKTGKI